MKSDFTIKELRDDLKWLEECILRKRVINTKEFKRLHIKYTKKPFIGSGCASCGRNAINRIVSVIRYNIENKPKKNGKGERKE